ncbi:MAG: chemotaxis protein CheW [Gammaproteobacteria bacterium]
MAVDEAAESAGLVRCLLIPLGGVQMLLPNASVAEIVNYREPRTIDNAPRWYAGELTWRGTDVPLLALEAASGDRVPSKSRNTHVVVITSLSGRTDMSHFAIVVQGIPHIVQADVSSLQPVDQGLTSPVALAHVKIHGQAAFIPDLDLLERMLRKARSALKGNAAPQAATH